MLDITQENFNNAESILIDIINNKYPNLDLSRGTVLRELLIKPAASIYADDTNRLDMLQSQYSIDQVYKSGQEAETTNLLLSNFLTTLDEGSKSTGQVVLRLMFDQDYVISEDLRLETADNIALKPVRETKLISTTSHTEGIQIEAKDDYYFAIVDMEAVDAGPESNIPQQTTLDTTTHFSGFTSAVTYTDFIGGQASETSQETIDRLSYNISNRSLESNTSITAKLTNQFPAIKELSVLGMGDREQLRDKHYVVAVGGRIDIYPKTFSEMPVKALRKMAVKREEVMLDDSTRSYIAVDISREDVPGFYMVRGIYKYSDIESIGSMIFEDRRKADLTQSFHDIKIVEENKDLGILSDYRESTYSIYQTGELELLSGNPKEGEEYRIDVYYTPYLKDIQEYVDHRDVRNLNTDIVVRSPLVGITSLKATIKLKDFASASDLDIVEAKQSLMDFVNNRGFTNILSKDQLSGVLLNSFSIIDNVDISDATNNGTALAATFRLADGSIKHLTGAILDVASVSDSLKLFSPNTTIFSLSPNNIFLTVI